MNSNLLNPSTSFSLRQRAFRATPKPALYQSIRKPPVLPLTIFQKTDSNPVDHEGTPTKISLHQNMQITILKPTSTPSPNISPALTENFLEKRLSNPEVRTTAEFEPSLNEISNTSPRKHKDSFVIKTMRSKDPSFGMLSLCNSTEDLQRAVSSGPNVQEQQPQSSVIEANTEYSSKNVKQEEQKRPQTVTKILVTANKNTQGTGQSINNIISVKKASSNKLPEPATNKTPNQVQKPLYCEPYRYGRTAQGSRLKRVAGPRVQNDLDIENEALVKVKLDFEERGAALNDNTVAKDQKPIGLHRFGFQRAQKISFDGSSKNRNISPNNQANLDAYESSNHFLRIQLTRAGPRPMLKSQKNIEDNDQISDFPITLRGEEVEVKTRIDEFAFEKVLGQGSYAVVKLARDKRTNQKYAVKTYERFKLYDTQRRKNVRLEISILKGLDHPNIIKLYYTILNTTSINLVMELGGQQSLHSYLKTKEGGKLDEEETRGIFRQIVEGTKYLHERNIAHRDLKTENILIENDNSVKIIDFGFSIQVQKDKLLTVCCGTPSYMAPELATRKDYDGICVDIWALGILLYVMLSGKFPFKGENDRDLYRKITRCSFERIKDVSIEAQGLINRILRFSPNDRLTAAQILEDNWIKGQRNSHQELNSFISEKLLEIKNNQKQLKASGMNLQDNQVPAEEAHN